MYYQPTIMYTTINFKNVWFSKTHRIGKDKVSLMNKA